MLFAALFRQRPHRRVRVTLGPKEERESVERREESGQGTGAEERGEGIKARGETLGERREVEGERGRGKRT